MYCAQGTGGVLEVGTPRRPLGCGTSLRATWKNTLKLLIFPRWLFERVNRLQRLSPSPWNRSRLVISVGVVGRAGQRLACGSVWPLASQTPASHLLKCPYPGCGHGCIIQARGRANRETQVAHIWHAFAFNGHFFMLG